MKPTIAQFTKWRDEGRTDFECPFAPEHNVRLAHCRVCGGVLKAGQGISYFEFMTDGYRGNIRYICSECEIKTQPPNTVFSRPAAVGGLNNSADTILMR